MMAIPALCILCTALCVCVCVLIQHLTQSARVQASVSERLILTLFMKCECTLNRRFTNVITAPNCDINKLEPRS